MNGLTFTGTAVTSGANNRGHTHTLNNGNTSSSGTLTTAGIRHSGSTGGMSANATGHMYVNYSGAFGNIELLSSGSSFDGNLSSSTKVRDNYASSASGQSNDCLGTLAIDVSHTHTLPSSYIYGKTDDESQNHTHSVTASGTISGDVETRPINYTIRVWKRVS